jgi:hypothetical protein
VRGFLPSGKDRSRAEDHLWQGFEFYEAAKNPRFDSRPLLYYYSFLNVTKTFLLARGIPIARRAQHGVTDTKSNDRKSLRLEGQQITVWPLGTQSDQLLPELIKILGGRSHKNPLSYLVLDLLAQVPAIQSAYLTIGRGRSPSTNPRGKRKYPRDTWQKGPCFAPVEYVSISTDEASVWATVVLDTLKSDSKRVIDILGRQRSPARQLHQVAEIGSDQAWFETVPQVIKGDLDGALGSVAEHLRRSAWASLTASGYRYYIAALPRAHRMPQLASMFATMFYLGSVTRYRPDDYDKILGGRYAWLVEEFIATQPALFMYLITSILAGVEVVPENAIA